MGQLVRYRTLVFDSARWAAFPFRPDDVVISTPPKCGTTWMQTICGMLLLERVEFARPLADISPWIDMQANNLAAVVATLEAQQHRRFLKTHTPLDGVPMVDGLTYVCLARDPRDVALSFQHHWANLDLDAFMAARARAVGLDDLAELGPPPDPLPEDPGEWFRIWVEGGLGELAGPSLADVLHHVDTFWQRRNDPGVVLFHYADLLADLPREVRRLAETLGVEAGDERVAQIAAACSFDRMKKHADELVPEVGNGIWRSNEGFFHRGLNGQWYGLVDDDSACRYEQRVAELVAPEVAAWVHSGWSGASSQGICGW